VVAAITRSSIIRVTSSISGLKTLKHSSGGLFMKREKRSGAAGTASGGP